MDFRCFNRSFLLKNFIIIATIFITNKRKNPCFIENAWFSIIFAFNTIDFFIITFLYLFSIEIFSISSSKHKRNFDDSNLSKKNCGRCFILVKSKGYESQFFSFKLLKIFEHYFIFLLKLFGENKLLKSVKPLLFNMKSINPKQRCPFIIEKYACNLYMFVVISLLPVNLLTSKLDSYVMGSDWLVLVRIY